ncbi:MAG TPA: ribbon-helix-helix protein, CopG family [Candidatus Eisenbacteria bacterium]|nr:ribbon-helix-helix protein, CopG family [Candidatus Eisenbacteria bacterium]
MPAAVKIAVTVPTELYRAVESARKRGSRSRSSVVQEALRHWLRHEAHTELVREYEAGYRRRPEGKREIDAAMATAIGLLRDEDDW